MIKINLALKKQPAGGGSEAAGEGLGLSKLTPKIDSEAIKQLPLPRIGLTLAVIFLAGWIVDEEKTSKLTALDKKIEQLQAKKLELQREKASLAGVKQIEEELEKNRVSLQNKIDAVDKLTLNRDAVYRTLKTLAEISPPDLWISSLKVEGASVEIKAKAPADSLVPSEFYRAIAENAQFAGSSATQQGEIQNALEKSGMRVSTFQITTKRRVE